MRDRFGIFGTVTRIRNCLLLVVMLRIPNSDQDTIEGVITLRIDSHTIKRGNLVVKTVV